MRRIGVLMVVADDAEGQPAAMPSGRAMQHLGWTEGRNMRIDFASAAATSPGERAGGRACRPHRRSDRCQPCASGDRAAAAKPAPSRSCLRSPDPVGGFRRKPGTARRQCHRLHYLEFSFSGEVAGIAQGDRAPGCARRPVLDPGTSSGRQLGAIQGVRPRWRGADHDRRARDREIEAHHDMPSRASRAAA